MPLDVAAEPGLFTSLLCGIVLLSLGYKAMGAGVLGWLLRFLMRSP